MTFSWINLNLFIFNILPIFPLDGGRITRDVITLITKNVNWATLIGSVISILVSVMVGYYFFLTSEWIIVALMVFFILINVLVMVSDKE